MKISTFNIKNNFDDYNFEKSLKIYNYLKLNKIDVLGLQEVFSKCNKDLLNYLKSGYYVVGKYRFHMHFLFRKCNEKTPIITKHKIIFKKTYHLPYFPSRLKRVMTYVQIEYKDRIISIYNTHLESRLMNVKKRQLNKIYNIISKDKNPKILMGDFNLKSDNTLFNNFVNKLKDLNMERIVLDEKTLKQSKKDKEIDHIFISNEFELKSKEVVKNLDISDHYPVMIELEI